MKKIIGKVCREIKIKYVARFLKHEDPRTLAREMVKRGLSKNNNYIRRPLGKYSYKYPGLSTLYNWVNCYNNFKQYGKWNNFIVAKKMSNKKYTEEDFDKEDYKRAYNICREILKERTGKDLTNQEVRKHMEKYKEKKVKTLAILNVPKSSFYYHNIPISEEEIKRIKHIDSNVKRIYEENFQNFGRKRVFIQSISENLNFTEEQVRTSMKRQGLFSIIRIQKRKKREDPKSPKENLPNLLKRDFFCNEPGTKYSTDTTYFESPHTKSGFIYICCLLDLFNFIPKGLNVSDHNDLELIKSTYLATQSSMKIGAIINSDHGSAHLANYIKEWANTNSFRLSAGKAGDTYANLPIETFWGILKVEWLNRIPYQERTIKRVKKELEKFYNWYVMKRPQSKLNYLTPEIFSHIFEIGGIKPDNYLQTNTNNITLPLNRV